MITFVLQKISDQNIQQFVVAQFHEPYYPDALPLPLIIETPKVSLKKQREIPRVCFSPSNKKGAFAERWETKARNEVLYILEKLKERNLIDYFLIEDKDFHECVELKADADIFIDDVVTGSFHTSSLESLALGTPTISYIDSRTQMVLAELTGTQDLPIINSKLEDLEETIVLLAKNPSLRQEIAKFSYSFIQCHYSEELMTKKYDDTFKLILTGQKLGNPRYSSNRQAKLWLYINRPNIEWKRRSSNSKKYTLIKKGLEKIKAFFKNYAV